MSRALLLSFTALAGVCAANGAAHAGDQLYGGGDTSAARVYRDLFDCYGAPLPYATALPSGIGA